MKTNVDTIIENAKKLNEGNKNVESIISELGSKTPDFEITLDQLSKETGLERAELVKQVRALKLTGVKYKVGRKGHPSVVLGGKNAEGFNKVVAHKTVIHNAPKRQIQSKANESGNYSLQLQIGESEKFNVPIKLELVH